MWDVLRNYGLNVWQSTQKPTDYSNHTKKNDKTEFWLEINDLPHVHENSS